MEFILELQELEEPAEEQASFAPSAVLTSISALHGPNCL
ncbi:MAG TPA: class III lanthipeptide [Actinophytocola sp.]|nr:class III lanthipeptide [Actinophytocola sp.]